MSDFNSWILSQSSPLPKATPPGTLDRQTPERASGNLVWFREGSWKNRSGVSVYRVHRNALLVLRSRLPCTDLKSGLQPEMGKKWPKNGFWPHREKGRKMAPKSLFYPFFGQFSHFSAIFFRFFPVRPKSFFGHFFPNSGRGPILRSVQGNRDRNSCRATEGTVNTQTPARASKNPVWFPEVS